jgi:hypothetical protein
LDTHQGGAPLIVDHQPGVIVFDETSPTGEAQRLRTAIDALGGTREEWGIGDAYPAGVTVVPFVLLPKIIQALLGSLGEVVAATTSVESQGKQADQINPNLRHRSSLLLLTGLD